MSTKLEPIKFWCQKVLPLVYDDSLSYYEVLAKTVDYLNNVIEDDKNVIKLVNNLEVWVNENKEYIDNYFENLNVQNEINVKLDEMVEDGTFGEIIDPILEQFEQDAMGNLSQQVSDWLEENITPTTPVIDATLTISGAGADAKVTGDEITDLKNALNNLKPVEYETAKDITEENNVDFSNATDGLLKSDGTVSGATSYCVSDFIPLDNVKSIFRYGTATKYNLEAYALYDPNKDMIAGTYHVRTTTYDYSTYNGHSYVVFYDISAPNAKYIRITKDKSIALYVYAIENVIGKNYVLNGDLHAQNINALEVKSKTIDLLNEKRLVAKNFVLYRNDRDGSYDHTYIDPTTGNISTGEAYYYKTSDFIEVEEETYYYTAFGYSVAFYDSNKSLLGGSLVYDSSLTGGIRWGGFTTPSNCSFIRICGNTTYAVMGVANAQNEFDILDLGDSIFGVNPPCFDIASIAQEKTGYRFANCGFGGSQASSYHTPSSPYASFSFWKLCDAIYAEDFTQQTADAETINNTDATIMYKHRMEILNNVDFSKIKLITVAYGTNDFSQNRAIDNESNKYDTDTYCGALRYGIEKLLSKYPSVLICLMSPPYRRMGSNNETSSDDTPNGGGKYLSDYVNAMKGVAEEYHLPFFDHYENMGVNGINWQTYLRDGTHLSYIEGSNLFGAKVGEEVNGILSEYI